MLSGKPANGLAAEGDREACVPGSTHLSWELGERGIGISTTDGS